MKKTTSKFIAAMCFVFALPVFATDKPAPPEALVADHRDLCSKCYGSCETQRKECLDSSSSQEQDQQCIEAHKNCDKSCEDMFGC
jgi:hypothetical protein